MDVESCIYGPVNDSHIDRQDPFEWLLHVLCHSIAYRLTTSLPNHISLFVILSRNNNNFLQARLFHSKSLSQSPQNLGPIPETKHTTGQDNEDKATVCNLSLRPL